MRLPTPQRWIVVALGLVLFTASCGDDGASPPPDDLRAPAALASCDSFGAAAALTNVGITYDYDPHESMTSLAAAGDLAIRGRIAWVSEAGTEGSDLVLLSVEVDEILLDRVGDTSVGEVLPIGVAYNPAEVGFGDISAAIELGTGVVVFLHQRNIDGFHFAHLEGFWLGCGEEGSHHVGVHPPWDLTTTTLRSVLDELRDAL